jgi:hypothetical protein
MFRTGPATRPNSDYPAYVSHIVKVVQLPTCKDKGGLLFVMSYWVRAYKDTPAKRYGKVVRIRDLWGSDP